MGNPALNKHGMFGFKTQSAHGVTAGATDWTWLPFVDEPTFK